MATKNALIVNDIFHGFSGSELASLDIGLTLQGMGYNVFVYSPEVTPPLAPIAQQAQLQLISDPAQLTDLPPMDLVWGHHAPDLTMALRQVKSVHHVVHATLSPYAPLETPPDYIARLSAALFNSAESMERWQPMLHGVAPQVFPNSVMPEFLRSLPSPTDLRKVAVISNHRSEYHAAIQPVLQKAGIAVHMIGDGGSYQIVTPGLLADYDAIISIGRTVQYALCLGLPVFCYDRFGGPGWITPANYESALYYNFSGRCTNNPRSGEAVAAEIQDGFATALAARDALAARAHKEFDLRANVQSVLDSIASKPAVDRDAIAKSSLLWHMAPALTEWRQDVTRLRVAGPQAAMTQQAGETLMAYKNIIETIMKLPGGNSLVATAASIVNKK